MTNLKKYLSSYKFISYNLILIVIIYKLTKTHPLDLDCYKDEKKLINWIANNTKSNSTFFVKDFDSFMIRVFAKRAVFSDSTWPFDENSLREWYTRLEIMRKADNFSFIDYLAHSKKHSFEYVLLSKQNSQSFKSREPIFSTSKWVIYSLF